VASQTRTALTPFAALADPQRRRLFLFVASTAQSVGREEAAHALGLTLGAAAFHLDRLVEAGVLAAEYRRPPGRSGPGAGRPAKRYRALRAEYLFSAPERRYEIIAAVLARAVAAAEADSTPISKAVRKAATTFGRTIGASVAPPDDDDPRAAMTHIAGLLSVWGYEPRLEAGCLTTSNCPFAALVEESGDLVCRVNLRLLKGVLKGAGATRLVAREGPCNARCCVVVLPR
jgi:predicted ArsR family transcriptional regulator